jgi:hypothetical protein
MENFFHRFGIWKTVFPAILVVLLLYIGTAIAADIDISVEGPGISNWAFTPGITNIDSTNITLNVSSISSTWTVSVADNLDFLKPASTVGKMAESDAGGVYMGTHVLGTALGIAGPTIPSNTTGASVILSGSNQIIEAGLKPVGGLRMPLIISQPVTVSDPALKGGHRYQVIVTFIAFAEGGPAPVVTGIVPSEGITGSTVTVTALSGSNFLPHTTAVLNRTGSSAINLLVTGVTPTTITGTLNLAGAGVGLWDVTVTNPDGRIGTKPQLFWVKYPAAPMIGSFGPPFGTRGAKMSIGVTGTGFQNGVVVNLTSGTSTITAVVSQVTPTTITGTITIPSNAPTGYWNLVVTNNDGQSATRSNAFRVS